MKFNRVLALSAVSLALAAQAAPANPGGNIGTLTLFPALYYNIFSVPASGSFNDPYSFTLTATSTVYGSIYTTLGTPDVAAVFVDSTLAFLGGGSGIWGPIPMPPQTLPEADAKKIAEWISKGASK